MTGVVSEREAIYRSVVENLDEGLLICDRGDRIVLANPRAEELTGYPSEELLGNSVIELLVAPEKRQEYEERTAASLDGERTSYEIELRRRDGSVFLAAVRAGPYLDSEGEVMGTVGAITDITAQRRAERNQARLQHLISTNAREWQMTFDAVESPLLIVDLSGRLRRLNRAASRLAGRPYTDLLDQPVSALGAGEPWRTAGELVAAVGESQLPRSKSATDPDLGRSWELAASPLPSRSGIEGRVVLVARDITGLVEMQETLRRSEMLAAIGSLVAGVAHEIRNPLFALSAGLDAFEMRFGEAAGARQYCDVLKGQVDRLDRLMEELLEYGRPPNLELAPGDFMAVLEAAIESCRVLARQKGIEILIQSAGGGAPPSLPAVPLDPQRCKVALATLVDGSIRHSRRGDTVAVELQVIEGEEQDWVACVVQDQGPGFRREDLPRVFEPFFARRRGGSGLGLPIVQRIVEQHGGQAVARPSPGGGTRMEITLPAQRPPG